MKANQILGGVLAVQLGLIALTWLPGSGSNRVSTAPVLSIDLDAVDSLSIARMPAQGEDPEPVSLKKVDEQWVIASAGDFPAQSSKVDEVLDKLTALKTGQRVATQKTSHGSLKVSDTEYGKWIAVSAAGQTTELYVGAARSNSVHVRLSDDDTVYLARGLSEWALKDTTRGYIDDVYVSFEPDSIASLSVANDHGGFTLTREDGVWTHADETLSLNQSEIETLIGKLAKIRLAEPVGKQVTPEMGLESGARVEWSAAEGDVSVDHHYVIGADVERQAYVKSDESDFVVRASQSSLKPIREAKLADLLVSIDDPS